MEIHLRWPLRGRRAASSLVRAGGGPAGEGAKGPCCRVRPSPVHHPGPGGHQPEQSRPGRTEGGLAVDEGRPGRPAPGGQLRPAGGLAPGDPDVRRRTLRPGGGPRPGARLPGGGPGCLRPGAPLSLLRQGAPGTHPPRSFRRARADRGGSGDHRLGRHPPGEGRRAVLLGGTGGGGGTGGAAAGPPGGARPAGPFPPPGTVPGMPGGFPGGAGPPGPQGGSGPGRVVGRRGGVAGGERHVLPGPAGRLPLRRRRGGGAFQHRHSPPGSGSDRPRRLWRAHRRDLHRGHSGHPGRPRGIEPTSGCILWVEPGGRGYDGGESAERSDVPCRGEA